jgi:NADH-quinone oxidoreductase subunit L
VKAVTSLAAWICIFSPLVGAAVTPLLARVHDKARDFGPLLFSFVAAAAALRLLPGLLHPETLPLESAVAWLDHPITIGFGVLIDPLSIVLANVVAIVSFIIMVYCLGYMKEDPARTRFWMWMNGFIGSMLLLVLANNLLFLFIGWKLVGVCSYGLIGYYYQDQRKYWIGGPAPTPFVTPSQAGLKALIVTGAGDMLMLGGILILYSYAGTLNFLKLYETAPTWLAAMAATPGMVALVSLLLLAGPLAKSAQFPFHEWLPEAMAGPGPVSALIHAATMVKSGVYLIARLLPLFYYGYWVAGIAEASWFFHLTAWIGAFTALLAATQAMVALELKKILAYSTVSQIGYMMLALGASGLAPGLLVEGYTSGLFHLVSHALFKACLFLCVGTIIHAVHSIYVQDMGALRKFLPLSWGFTLVASLSLMGMPPFPGFWSKDAVLLVTLKASTPLFALALVTVALTAFYTMRFLGLVFHGPKSTNLDHVIQEQGHVTDGAPSMRLASGILALFIVTAGVASPFVEQILHHGFASGLGAELAAGSVAPSMDGSSFHGVVPALALLFLVAGAWPAHYLYVSRKASSQALINNHTLLQALYHFFWNRWSIEGIYHRVFVDGTTRLAAFLSDDVEERWDNLVHRRLPALFTEKAQRLVHRLRTETEELVYNVSYILVLLVVLLTFFLLGRSGN